MKIVLDIFSLFKKHSEIPLTSNDDEAYSLRLFDDELLYFTMSRSGLEGLKTRILRVNYSKRRLLPPDLELTDEALLEWLKRRIIPKNRAFVTDILNTMGLTPGDTKGIIDVCKGLSLNDSYWVTPSGFNDKFKDFNLYENGFSEILSLVAYTGRGRTHQPFTTSPEFTTHGMLRKAWRVLDDGIYLFKGGTEGFMNAGLEPYSEYYAYQVAQRMGLNAVPYDLVKWKGILSSKCKLFTDINTAYIPIGHLVRKGGLSACLDFYSGISQQAVEDISSMLVFDAAIYNEDRHFGNFGVLMDSRTCQIKSAAPIFDNGVSLFNYAVKEDIADLKNYARTRPNPYDIPYEEICSEVLGQKQRAQLKRLIGFRFKRHSQYNLPEYRVKAIERQINLRVCELLSLPKKTAVTLGYVL